MLLRLIFLLILIFGTVVLGDEKFETKDPTVLIVTLIRNKAYTLTYFFSYLQDQDYDKKRISLWIRSDHNEDYSLDVLNAWLKIATGMYHSVSVEMKSEPQKREHETSPFEWTDERYRDVIRMKDEAFQKGRKMLADYVFFLDADVFLTDNQALKKLVNLNLPIVAPMLESQSLYTNFWGGMRENYYYKRTHEYLMIKKREKIGEAEVPLVNSAILVNMNMVNSKYLTHNKSVLINYEINSSETYDGPWDDQIVFAISAKYAGLPMYISNSHKYGYIMAPMPVEASLIDEANQVVNLLVMFLRDQTPPVVPAVLDEFTLETKKTTLGFSKIFVINLDRRQDRFKRFSDMADIIGLKYQRFSAVDGETLTTKYLKNEGIRVIPHYEHLRQKRPMRLGDVGCLWSHYKIWEEIVDKQLKEVLILQDGVTFERYFRFLAQSALDKARTLLTNYDFIYFGKSLYENATDDEIIPAAKYLRKPGFSFSSRGYVLTLNGAKKLIKSDPLRKMVPVDEYVSIIYDKHPDKMFKKYFPVRNLNAYAVEPSILQDLYERSDTENSKEIEDIETIYAEEPSFRDEL